MIAASPDGTAVALVEDGVVRVIATASREVFAEIGIPGDASDHEVAFAGMTLLVLAQTSTGATLHVIDPFAAPGPALRGNHALSAGTTIAAIAGERAILRAGHGGAVLDLDARRVLPLAVRAPIVAATYAGDDLAWIATGGVLELWDARTRNPGRRLRRSRPIAPLALGASAQRVWWLDRAAPDQLDVVGLAAGSHRTVALAGPARAITGRDVLLAIGATTGAVTLIDLARGGTAIACGVTARAAAWLGPTMFALALDDGSLEVRSVDAPTASIAPRAPAPPRAQPTTPAARDDLFARLTAWRERARRSPLAA